MKKAVLEGLLFVVGEEGLTLDQIEDVLNDVEGILSGKFDEVDESKFLFVGKIS